MIKTLKYIRSIYAQPGARLGRKGFMLGLTMFILFVPLLTVLPALFIYYYLGFTPETFGNAELWIKLLTLGWYLVFFYFSFYCLLSIHIKRLHDLDHLGWWLLAVPLYPIMIFFLVIKEGNPKENDFGEPCQ